MRQFIRIPNQTLKEIVAQGQEQDAHFHSRIPPEYFSPIPPIRWVFWQRLQMLHSLMNKYAPDAQTCLDFGGGGGVFTPTLAKSYPKVSLLDLATREARNTVDRYGLDNVTLMETDATKTDLPDGSFDCAVAADVLEHFLKLDDALDPLLRWIKPGGLLFTSLPTETWVYAFLRLIFRTEKPEDHYHKAIDVERYMEQRGFVRLERRYAPLYLRITPLYYITVWRRP